MIEPLRIDVEIDCPPEHAFATWTERFGTWWPPTHTVSGDPAVVVLEPRLGGRIYERTGDGHEVDWGEITHWDPPRALTYLWHIRRDRADATDVEIRFVAAGPASTRLEITHSGWERLGAGAERWRNANRGGWSGLLPHFTAAATQGGTSMTATGTGTAADPWVLKTPPGTSEYQMYRDDKADPPELVCLVGSTKLRYLARCLDDVPTMLAGHGDWMELGSADENKAAKNATLEAWARSESNPVGGWYGLRKGYRGRFAMYVPPLLEHLGLVELEHNPRNNRVRARRDS